MSIEKEPFVNYTLGEKTKDTFTVRLNDEERKMLEEIKDCLNVAQDGKALKIAARIGLNVLHNTFGRDFLRYLFKKDRLKQEDSKGF